MFWIEHEFLALIFTISSPFLFIGALCFMEWLDEKSVKFHEFTKRTSDAFGFGYSNRKRR